MEIFKWVKDVEKIYEDLIEKTTKENLVEIQNIRNQQENLLEETLGKKQKFVSDTLKNLSNTVNNNTKTLEKNLEIAIKNIETNYQKDRTSLEKSIIEKLGFDF